VSELAVKPLRVVAGHRTSGARWSAAVLAAAVLSLVAGWIHFAYATSHWDYWWAYGAFFVATGAFQALLAPALLRWPGSWTGIVGIAGNLAIIWMYLKSRTDGIPMGPHAGVLEKVTPVDMACTVAEVATIVLLLGVIGPQRRRWVLNVLFAAGAAIWVLRFTNTWI
jgi:hypothetical protein